MAGIRERSFSPWRRKRASVTTSAAIAVFLSLLVLLRPEHRASEPRLSQFRDQDLAREIEEIDQNDNADLRKLQASDDISFYPDDGILRRPYGTDPNRWLIILHCFGIGYMLLGLNTVCDIYFAGSLEEMVQQWKIKPDVAGATFMAAGGSAPEFFTSMIGATIAHNDVGFSTIVGSAVFNVLFVIGLCGYVAKDGGIDLSWWPLFRDCSYYIFGLSLLAYCASDGSIVLGEAIGLFSAYIVYAIMMSQNSKLEAFTHTLDGTRDADTTASHDDGKPQTFVGNWTNGDDCSKPLPPQSVVPTPPSSTPSKKDFMGSSSSGSANCNSVEVVNDLNDMQGSPDRQTSKASGANLIGRASQNSKDRASADGPVAASSSSNIRMSSKLRRSQSMQGKPLEQQRVQRLSEKAADEHEEGGDEEKNGDGDGEEEEDDLMEWPETRLEQVQWVLGLPVIAPIYFLTPRPSERTFLFTFLCSLVWVAGFSFFLVWWVEILGEVLGIDTIIMGFTLLAAGTSIPDAVSSMAVAREGEGDMAVSSSIGSNVFDILVGLPIPWIIKIVAEGGQHKIKIRSRFVVFHTLLLLGMVCLVVVSIHLHGWRLNKPLGSCMAGLYVIFLCVALSVEKTSPEWLMF